ncbi:uncharacterized protein LOC134262402 isoform X2 [Saccostrea cucullata]|uniref:uncharacterized protein LOC134262402 isoform X2 n=1 Tax=Saccostrea cuccullata TaxID=36930 RepID=UPI002ED0BFAE
MFQFRGSGVFLWILYTFISKVCNSSALKCYASQPTGTEVQKCPLTPKELEEAAQRKNCEIIALSQNCTKPENFKYHCVLSMNRQSLMEVCAPYIFSQGHCVGFDTLGLLIQQIFDSSCTKFPDPCPIRFASWNSSAFSGCYELIENKQRKPNAGGAETTAVWIGVSCGTFIFGLIMTVLVQTLCRRLKDYKKRKGKITENQNENDNSKALLCDINEETDISLTRYDASGFDKEGFDKVIKDFHLTSVEELFKQHHIDCVVTFLGLDNDKLQSLGLDIGQQEKCKNAIRRIQCASNNKMRRHKGDSQTSMSISERSESRDQFPSAQSVPTSTEKKKRPPHKRTLSYPT